jgi:hypothetical protein
MCFNTGRRTATTRFMVKRVVDDIDKIVRAVRFDGWQKLTRVSAM